MSGVGQKVEWDRKRSGTESGVGQNAEWDKKRSDDKRGAFIRTGPE